MARLLSWVTPPSKPIFRVARRGHDPFDPPSWEYRLADGTFGHRFDDPAARYGASEEARFRMIYCATEREGAFGETIAHFRPSLATIAGLKEVEASTDREPLHFAILPADWCSSRWLGKTRLDPALRFVDVEAPDTLQVLRETPKIAQVAVELGLPDIDRSVLTGPYRLLTQQIARIVYEQTERNGQPSFAGLRYLSRLNPDWECWAIYSDRIVHTVFPTEPIAANDPALLVVASLFSVSLEDATEDF